MKNIKNQKKNNLFKKIFIKLCRVLGFEIIDQSDFYFPVSNKDSTQNLSELGKKSISIALGETKITRAVKSLTIIIKTCTSINLVTQNKKRVFESDKLEYTLRTINSIISNLNNDEGVFQKIDTKIIIIDDNSKKEDLILIKKKMEKYSIKFKIINLDINLYPQIKTLNKNNTNIENNMKATMASILKSFEVSKEDDSDLFYFVEDDYIHKKNCLSEMIFAYEKITSVIKREVFLCPVDYPYLYKTAESTNILIGHKYHWRRVKESLLTFMTSKKMIEKHWEKLMKMSEIEHSPFETPLHEIYDEEICLSPIPSLAMHCTNVNSVFGLSPNMNWKKLWDENK